MMSWKRQERDTFLQEIELQIKNEEHNEDIWKKTVLWRTIGFYPVDLDMVKYLVGHGADVNSKNRFEESILQIAVKYGLVDIAKYLIEHGADVNVKDKVLGCTVLHTAVESASLDMVKYLVQHGAVINWEDDGDGKKALYFALKSGSTELAEAIMTNGSNDKGFENSKETKEKNDIFVEQRKMRFRTEVKHQIENDGNRDVWNKTVLWQAFRFKPVDLVVVKYLIEHGADVNSDRRGESVLFEAVRSGSMNSVKFLVEHCDADVNYQGDECICLSALALAVEYNWVEAIQYLIEHGSGLNILLNHRLLERFTNINLALRNKARDWQRDLQQEGIDEVSKKSLLGFNIFLLAVEKNSIDLVKLLINKGVVERQAIVAKNVLVNGEEISPIQWSISLGHDDITNILKQVLNRSVKHCEKIELLKRMNVNQLSETDIPMDIFAADDRLQIGKGSLGTSVYVGVMKDGSEVAVKRMFAKFSGVAAENEREVLNLIGTTQSPYIVNYRHFHEDSLFMFLIVDICEENLKEYVNSHSIQYLKQHAPKVIREILTGLGVLHDQGILHRDLKPANVLVDIKGHMKLADFGLSRVLDEDETTVHTEAKGTTGWMAAEVIEAIKSKTKSRYKKKSDVQVAGMIAYFILSKGEHPFGSSLDRMGNIVRGKSVSLKGIKERNARQFVSWLINHNIDKRPFVQEALEHLFLKGH